jgi:hypothetical protein
VARPGKRSGFIHWANGYIDREPGGAEESFDFPSRHAVDQRPKPKVPPMAREITSLSSKSYFGQRKYARSEHELVSLRAPEDGPIRRTYLPGGKRAARDSVRWMYTKEAR